MKFKALLAALIGAVALQGAMAGTSWCPSSNSGGKGCKTDCCPDLGASIAVGYDSAYVYKGIRLADDVAWFDANYTLDNLPLSPTIGVTHLTDLSSRANINTPAFAAFGDQTRLYTGVNLPCILGFESALQYSYFLFPTQRFPQGTPGVQNGDSRSQVSLNVSRELFCGTNLVYTADYLFGGTYNNNVLAAALPYRSVSGWMHTLALTKSFCITDCVGLDLSGGVLYNDNYWEAFGGNVSFYNNLPSRDSGWHSYFVRAALPIALNCRATLIPYLQYNGTPDSWTGDGMMAGLPNTAAGAVPGGRFLGNNANFNDLFYGGVSLRVNF